MWLVFILMIEAMMVMTMRISLYFDNNAGTVDDDVGGSDDDDDDGSEYADQVYDWACDVAAAGNRDSRLVRHIHRHGVQSLESKL